MNGNGFPSAPPPRPDARPPEAMPTRGWVEWYDRARGFGVVLTITHERFSFDGEKTSGGPPAPGTPVTIRWMRSRGGHWNVPSEIVPDGYIAPVIRFFQLQEWLRGFDAVTGKLKGLTAGMLKRAHGESIEPWPDRGSCDDAWLILSALEQSIEGHDRWIRTFDWKEVDDGWLKLPEMIGVRVDEIRPQPNRGIETYFLDECNARSRTGERLYSLVTNSDCYCMVALRPAAYEVLVRDGFIR